MTRPVRVEFPGAVYHVTARGNERRKTFRDDADRLRFLAALEGKKGLEKAIIVFTHWRFYFNHDLVG